MGACGRPLTKLPSVMAAALGTVSVMVRPSLVTTVVREAGTDDVGTVKEVARVLLPAGRSRSVPVGAGPPAPLGRPRSVPVWLPPPCPLVASGGGASASLPPEGFVPDAGFPPAGPAGESDPEGDSTPGSGDRVLLLAEPSEPAPGAEGFVEFLPAPGAKGVVEFPPAPGAVPLMGLVEFAKGPVAGRGSSGVSMGASALPVG